MTTFESIEEAREFFNADKFAAKLGIQLDELGEDYCICSVDIKEDFRNGFGAVMGGAIFTLGDFAFAVMSNQLHKLTVGLQVSINYLRMTQVGKLPSLLELDIKCNFIKINFQLNVNYFY